VAAALHVAAIDGFITSATSASLKKNTEDGKG